MTPAYKLTYYPVKALAEPIRFLFSYGGIEFEDIRFKLEDWPQIKPNMPFGQVPVLEHNGKKADQSVAIARYVAKKVKLTGKDEWEDLEIDSVVDTITDLQQSATLYYFEKDEAIKESRKGPLFNETLPFYLGKLDALVNANNGHLVGGRLTWADIYFGAYADYFEFMCGSDVFDKYSNLRGLTSKVLALPAIKAWVAKRPKTER